MTKTPEQARADYAEGSAIAYAEYKRRLTVAQQLYGLGLSTDQQYVRDVEAAEQDYGNLRRWLIERLEETVEL
jgi:predicted metal-dependent hydrolase